MRVLIICTGNLCRSQIAEGFLKLLDSKLVVFSAGICPETKINPFAIRVMKEINIDISSQKPKTVEYFAHDLFDFVIAVCDFAQKNCPVFSGKVGKKVHIGFDDPAKTIDSDEEILKVYRETRDAIYTGISGFFSREIKHWWEVK